MTPKQMQDRVAALICVRDAATGPAKTALRKEIVGLERQLAITRAMTARQMGDALYQSDVGDHIRTQAKAADVCSYIGRVLIGRSLMMNRTVRLDLENGYHVVCTLEKI